MPPESWASERRPLPDRVRAQARSLSTPKHRRLPHSLRERFGREERPPYRHPSIRGEAPARCLRRQPRRQRCRACSVQARRRGPVSLERGSARASFGRLGQVLFGSQGAEVRRPPHRQAGRVGRVVLETVYRPRRSCPGPLRWRWLAGRGRTTHRPPRPADRARTQIPGYRPEEPGGCAPGQLRAAEARGHRGVGRRRHAALRLPKHE